MVQDSICTMMETAPVDILTLSHKAAIELVDALVDHVSGVVNFTCKVDPVAESPEVAVPVDLSYHSVLASDLALTKALHPATEAQQATARS